MDKAEAVQRIRAFNRYYTSQMGLLEPKLYGTDYSLSETRILYEIYTMENCSQKKLVETLRLDKGYLSKVLKKLEQDGQIQRLHSEKDMRVVNISLTAQGTVLIEHSIEVSNRQVAQKLAKLYGNETEELCKALETVQKYFEREPMYIMW